MPLNIPTKNECFRLIAHFKMLDHIVLHSKQVANVALFLTDQLNAKSCKLNRELVFAAALLHDITKTRSFKTGENHAQSGAQLISDLGYLEVGNIIGQHVHLKCFNDQAPPNEAEVVNYADKRVLHENVVNLDERMDYIIERYGATPFHLKRIEALWQETRRLEQKLFGHLKIEANELICHLPTSL